MVVSSRLREVTRSRAGVEQSKAAGAVGRFHHAGLEAALPDRRRLLVAGHAENANGRAEQIGRGRAEIRGAISHLRQQSLRHAEHPAQAVIPLPARNIEQQRARGVAGVGCVHLAAGEPPQQETIDGAEGELACLRLSARACHVIEQPGDLAGGKIRIEQQPGFGGDLRFMAAGAQRIAKIGGAPVLPDNRIVNRLAGGAVPDDGGFTLIGDADAGDILGRQARPSPWRRARMATARRPDFLGVVLDPSGRRIDLAQLLLRAGERLQAGIERDGARRCGALVDGDESGRQSNLPGEPAETSSPRQGWRLPDRCRHGSRS